MTINNLHTFVNRGTNSLKAAGECVRNLNQTMSLAEISRESGLLTVRNLKDLTRIADGEMLPELMAFKIPATLYIKKLNIHKQIEVLRSGVEVLRPKGNQLVKCYVPVSGLHHRDCKIVFNGDSIRSIWSQRRLLKKGIKKSPTYKVENGRVIILKKTSFSTGELKSILANI